MPHMVASTINNPRKRNQCAADISAENGDDNHFLKSSHMFDLASAHREHATNYAADSEPALIACDCTASISYPRSSDAPALTCDAFKIN